MTLYLCMLGPPSYWPPCLCVHPPSGDFDHWQQRRHTPRPGHLPSVAGGHAGCPRCCLSPILPVMPAFCLATACPHPPSLLPFCSACPIAPFHCRQLLIVSVDCLQQGCKPCIRWIRCALPPRPSRLGCWCQPGCLCAWGGRLLLEAEVPGHRGQQQEGAGQLRGAADALCRHSQERAGARVRPPVQAGRRQSEGRQRGRRSCPALAGARKAGPWPGRLVAAGRT